MLLVFIFNIYHPDQKSIPANHFFRNFKERLNLSNTIFFPDRFENRVTIYGGAAKSRQTQTGGKKMKKNTQLEKLLNEIASEAILKRLLEDPRRIEQEDLLRLLPEDRAILLRNHPISSRRQPILPAEKFHAFLTNRKRKLMKELKLPAGIVKCRSFRFCSNGWIGLITPSGVYKQRLFIFLWILSVLSSKNAVGVIIHRIMKEGGLFQVSFSETLEA